MEETKQMENPDPQSFQSGTSSAEADFPIPQEEKMKELSTLEECSLDPNDEISALKAEIDRLRTSLSQKEEEQKKVMEEMEDADSGGSRIGMAGCGCGYSPQRRLCSLRKKEPHRPTPCRGDQPSQCRTISGTGGTPHSERIFFSRRGPIHVPLGGSGKLQKNQRIYEKMASIIRRIPYKLLIHYFLKKKGI